MNPHDIKASLLKKGSSMSKIARQVGVSPAAVSHIVHHLHSSRRIEAAIIEATGIPGHRLWPRRYSKESGSRVA